MGHYVIFLFPTLSTKWPWEKIWPLSHARTGNCMTYRRKMRSRSWRNREGYGLQEKNEIRVMEEQGRPWPTGEKWNLGHGGTGKTMAYRRIMRFRSWGNREDHDLQEKMRSRSRGRSKSYDPQNEIENRTMFLPFCPVCRDAPSLFRLFANTLHKINHARRNLTFICKITPRVNFYYLL